MDGRRLRSTRTVFCRRRRPSASRRSVSTRASRRFEGKNGESDTARTIVDLNRGEGGGISESCPARPDTNRGERTAVRAHVRTLPVAVTARMIFSEYDAMAGLIERDARCGRIAPTTPFSPATRGRRISANDALLAERIAAAW